MTIYFSEDGVPFAGPPYSEADNEAFEQRLRNGKGITIIREAKRDRPAPLQDGPAQ